MYFEIFLVPWAINILLFVIFFIVAEGTRWQRHKTLGGFARFIQASPARGFFVFFILTVMMIPLTLLVLHGSWLDMYPDNIPANTTPIVSALLMTMLLLALSIPVMWSHFRTWRQAVRSAAEVKVRSTQ